MVAVGRRAIGSWTHQHRRTDTIASILPSRPEVIRENPSPVAREQPEGIAIAPDGEAGVGGERLARRRGARGRYACVAWQWIRCRVRHPVRVSRFRPDGRRAVITDPMKATIRCFDVATRRERFQDRRATRQLVATAEVAGSPSPEGVIISPESLGWAFVTLQGRNAASQSTSIAARSSGGHQPARGPTASPTRASSTPRP